MPCPDRCCRRPIRPAGRSSVAGLVPISDRDGRPGRDRQAHIVLWPVKGKSRVPCRAAACSDAAVGDDTIPRRNPERPVRDRARARSPTRPSTRSSPSSTRSASAARGRAPSSSTRTGLGRAIVAQRVGELLERGLVVEGDAGPSTGGRPPRQLTFRAEAGHVLVADLGATSIDVAVTDARRADPRPPRRARRHRGGPGGAPRPGRGAVRPAARDDPRAARAGCGASGSASRARSSSRPAGRSRRRSCPAGTATRSASGSPPATRRPVWVDNDVNVLALGEWRVGRRRRATTTSSSSRSGRASAPGSSRTAGSTAARRAAPATSATSRSSDDRVGRLPLRQHRLPRGAGRRRGDRARRARRRRATGRSRAAAGRARRSAAR